MRILGNPQASLEHIRDFPKVNVFYALPKFKVYDRVDLLDMLQHWAFPHLKNDSADFIYQQDVHCMQLIFLIREFIYIHCV